MRDTSAAILKRFEAVAPVMNEQSLRRFVAAEAIALGYGGVSLVSRITKVARSTINRGVAEIKRQSHAGAGRVRKTGGGRKRNVDKDPTLEADLKKLVEPTTRGDPMRPLLSTSHSLVRLQQALKAMKHNASTYVIRHLLQESGYSLQGNRKTREGGKHPDRNAQFEYINDKIKEHMLTDDPVLSVDTKKKELVGNYKNNGREWRPKDTPEDVKVHDFIDPALGRAVPYGIYDITNNVGWVSVGNDHDTAAFAVNALRRWWQTMGKERFPQARRLMITADGGGSNGSRVRLWKIELQKLANELEMPITVCHLPPGTSKWNKIEHKLFSFITINWRGKPLRTYQTIIQLISATTTKAGLKVRAELDTNAYPKGIKVSNDQLDAVNLSRHSFCGNWNYTIAPLL
jgi:hypothetical protein